MTSDKSQNSRKESYGGVLTAYGVSFAVRSNRVEALGELVSFLPLGTKSSPHEKTERTYELRFDDARHSGLHVLYRDRRAIARSPDPGVIFDRFESDATVYVADRANNRVFVHAGVVAVAGRAVLLPGRSMAGKSRLVSALLRAGAVYYSDEFAVLDSDGRVHPYARSLQMRKNGETSQTRHPAAEFGAETGNEPLPVSLVALVRFKSGVLWSPKQLSEAEAVFEMMKHTACARRFPERALQTLRIAVTNAGVFEGARGEVHEVVEWIFSQLTAA